MGDATAKRTYLVVVDDSAEARVALRFAARRAAKTNGRVEVLGIVEPQDFVQFGGVQKAMEEEQRLRIEGVVSSAIGELLDESGSRGQHHRPAGRSDQGGARLCRRAAGDRGVGAGRRAERKPGPLVANFSGTRCRHTALPGDDHPRSAWTTSGSNS